MDMNRAIRNGIGALMLFGFANAAHAQVIAADTNINANVFADGAFHLIPITAGGGTSLGFFTSVANQRVVISFNAECSVKGTDNVSWLNIDVLVDGVPARPSNDDNAFCTDSGNNLLSNWVSAVTTVVHVVPNAGFHTVQVRGQLVVFNAGDQWRVDDKSVVVMR